MEAQSEEVPLYERIRFLSIFSSNLEEFYQVRVANLRASLSKKIYHDCNATEARQTLLSITHEVKRQERQMQHTFTEIINALRAKGIHFYTDYREFDQEQQEYVQTYFREEIFPFLYPTPLSDKVRTFLRDKRLYLCVTLEMPPYRSREYYLIKIPYEKVKRILPLPHSTEGVYAYTPVEEMVKACLHEIFPKHHILAAQCLKISRDSEIYIKEEAGTALADNMEKYLAKRKIGDVSRLMYEKTLPEDALERVCQLYCLHRDDLLPSGCMLQISDLKDLPNPLGKSLERSYPATVSYPFPSVQETIIDRILQRDLAVHPPYHSFSVFLSLLREARKDPRISEVLLTQYRVAEKSEVIEELISLADAGKKVTVFVELKARFDEANNLMTAHTMKRHGIRIIYSLPKLKVHAKTALLLFHPGSRTSSEGVACFSTGNFNEQTSTIYSDMIMLTAKRDLVSELHKLFLLLAKEQVSPCFRSLLVPGFNMLTQLEELIEYEIQEASQGREAYICLKMNALHDKQMIGLLYKASEAGVRIDLIVRGICCLIPGKPYSENITVTRIVDMYLEHSRIWYFHHKGEEKIYLSSADWMKRNLHHRIEYAAPVCDSEIKMFVKKILATNLRGNVKACILDEWLENISKRDNGQPAIRVQEEMYHIVSEYTQTLSGAIVNNESGELPRCKYQAE